MGRRLLVVASAGSYRLPDILAAAARLGVEPLVATDAVCPLAAARLAPIAGLDLARPEAAGRRIAAALRDRPPAGVIAADERAAEAAAGAAAALGLRGHAPGAVARARDKSRMRAALARAGLPVPEYRLHPVTEDAARAATAWRGGPCVIKPVAFSGSRGVIRADDPSRFVRAFARVARLVSTAEDAPPGDAREALLVERYLPGEEIAVEGLMAGGRLEVIAVFDKPDPLTGPYFAETIYVTPSRKPPAVLAAAAAAVADAARALGLAAGPLHAEVRLTPAGPVVLEVAPRAIGGRCGRALSVGGLPTLEDLLVRDALGLPWRAGSPARASGVLMVPVPKTGRLRAIRGLDRARRTKGVSDAIAAVQPGQRVTALPEGSRYAGFVFAEGATPAAVEAALRRAAARIVVDVEADVRC